MWVYLSPHLDDAAYSCGGLIAAQRAAGEKVVIWTLFAGDPPPGPLSAFAETVHKKSGGSAHFVAERRDEDHRCCAHLGVNYHHYDFADAIYRRRGTTSEALGGVLYDSAKSVFGCPLPWDRALLDHVVARLLPEVPAGARLVAPLGLGNHVDHLLARAAAERLFSRGQDWAQGGSKLYYYADLPYAAREQTENDKLLDQGWKTLNYRLDVQAISAWKKAIGAYQSQLQQLWGGSDAADQAIDALVSKQGGARLWQKTVEAWPSKGEQPAARRILLLLHQRGPISPRLPIGGGPTSFFELGESFQQAAAEVTILAELDEQESYRHNGVWYHCVTTGETTEQQLSLLSHADFDIIISQRAHLLDAAARHFPMAVRMLRVIDTMMQSQQRPPDFINERFDVVVAVSRYVKSILVQFGLRQEKIIVSNDGLRSDIFRPLEGVSRQNNLVLFVGATVTGKGFAILADAIDLLVRAGHDIKLEVHGAASIWSGNPDRADWAAVSAERPYLVYKGKSDKQTLVDAYNRATVCVVPTDPNVLKEGLGRVSIEAQACGCPVLVSRSGGLVETMIDGTTGRIVDPLSVETLAAAIAGILEDKEGRASMSAAAAEHASQVTVDAVASRLLRVADQVRANWQKATSADEAMRHGL